MKLSRYIAAEGIKVPDFASHLGVTECAVYRYLRGARIPSADVLSRIVKETRGRVTVLDFYPADIWQPLETAPEDEEVLLALADGEDGSLIVHARLCGASGIWRHTYRDAMGRHPAIRFSAPWRPAMWAAMPEPPALAEAA